MKMMHYYKNAAKIEIPYEKLLVDNKTQCLFKLLLSIKDWADTSAHVYLSKNGEENKIYIFFPGIAYEYEDFLEIFGESLISLEEYYKFEIYSTAVESPDSIYMEIEREDDKYYAVFKSVSGQISDIAKSLSISIVDKNGDGERLFHMLNNMDWEEKIIILSGQEEKILKEYDLPVVSENCFFAYAYFKENCDFEKFQNSLSLEQKTLLWKSFLLDGLDYLEFNWILKSIEKDQLYNRTEWEFALYQCLQDLKYKVIISENKFELRDQDDKPIYFNFNDGRFSDRCFLKMLFPIKI